jgi:type I restriction enzyme S subunit
MVKWEFVRLGEIGSIVTGKTPRTDDPANYGGDYMFIGPTDLHKHFVITNSEKSISSKGLLSIKGSIIEGVSILVGCIGWDIGNVSIVNSKCATNQQINSITKIRNLYNPIYIYYWLKNKKEYLFKISNVTRTPILNKSDFSKIEVNIPNRKRQDDVSNLLSSLDSKIELNNRINVELEQMTKTIYDYWFVQFDFPISAEYAASVGQPSLEGKPYKSNGGKMVWSEELKREVPEGWEVVELSDIANITMGQSPPGSSYNEESKGTIFFQGCTDFGNRFPTIRKFTTDPTRFAKIGDILLSVRAPVGTMNIANNNCCIGRGLAALNSKDNCISYLFGVMVNLKQVFDRRNTDGTTFGSITKDDLYSLKVVRPTKPILESYNQLMNPSFLLQNELEGENQKLAELRDWLLPMLMNGQVKVVDVEDDVIMGMAAEAEYKLGGEMNYKQD